jgi:hypothetical protein
MTNLCYPMTSFSLHLIRSSIRVFGTVPEVAPVLQWSGLKRGRLGCAGAAAAAVR